MKTSFRWKNRTKADFIPHHCVKIYKIQIVSASAATLIGAFEHKRDSGKEA
jgi:hypothetical protein